LALFSIRSFRSAADWVSCGKARLNAPRQMRSASRSRNPTITLIYNASRYGTQVIEQLGCEVLNLPGNDVSTWLDGPKARASRANARLKSIGVPVP
jgi:hypothetical protein